MPAMMRPLAPFTLRGNVRTPNKTTQNQSILELREARRRAELLAALAAKKPTLTTPQNQE